MPRTHSPQSVAELVKLIAKHGKRAFLVSGVDPRGDRIPASKVVIDLTGVRGINEIERKRNHIMIGTGINLGRLVREVSGENGLLQQTASLVANPLVRNKITFLEALDPESPYFDITTPLVLLEAKVRLQSPAGKRTLSIRDFLETVTTGLKKGEIPIAVEFAALRPGQRVGFFRVARKGGKGSVSAAARLKVLRNVCVSPEIVVSSLTLIPLRAKAAEKQIADRPVSEYSIKRAAAVAADEILELAGKDNPYERTLIEIAVARTLRTIL